MSFNGVKQLLVESVKAGVVTPNQARALARELVLTKPRHECNGCGAPLRNDELVCSYCRRIRPI